MQSALPPVLKQLQLSPFDDATEAAADLLRAACQGNEANKSVVRKEWGIPLLVLLIGPAVPRPLVERAIDCLRILTTNSDENRGALIGCNSALPYLLSLMDEDKTSEVCVHPCCVHRLVCCCCLYSISSTGRRTSAIDTQHCNTHRNRS